ncbi:MAG TPA: NAD(P)H-dependent glycerol-3-phosphate dehydrogenase [Stellaceae bacterium]|nr:NAD(P)H-dependent glycerol-3-phosphate dehydrogenase [Stellaceae bacterium]
MRRLAVIGGGAWGTALALVARRAGSDAVIWARDRDVAAAIAERHENPVYLPGIALDPAIAATADLEAATRVAEAAVLAVPAQFLRGVLTRLTGAMPAGLPVLICAKGIEAGTGRAMSEVVAELLPGSPMGVLSGPSFALEVAQGLPTAVTIASGDAALARAFSGALGSPRFRPYLSGDPIGAEIGGAVKNVLAIACGIILGRGLGDNARAALITRGLAEMIRLGLAKGGRAETFSGLSGLGDLVLTCSALKSRNHALGHALGRGESLQSILAGRRSVVEGVATSAAVVALAGRLGVEMPISEAVAAVIHKGVAIEAMTDRLLRRPYRSE